MGHSVRFQHIHAMCDDQSRVRNLVLLTKYSDVINSKYLRKYNFDYVSSVVIDLTRVAVCVTEHKVMTYYLII